MCQIASNSNPQFASNLDPSLGTASSLSTQHSALGVRSEWRRMPLCIALDRGGGGQSRSRAAERSPVDGGVNPRINAMTQKAGTRFAARDQPLLAIVRSDANGCSVALCQRRQPPKAGAVGQRLQRVARIAILEHQERRLVSRRRADRSERPYGKTIAAPERTVRRLCADFLAAANIA
jgi:hypothetical protein